MKGKILIVDDEPANIYLLEELLSDYTIRSAFNAEDMFARLKDESPDLILLDIMMPGMDCFTIAEKLGKDELYRDIPVIFVSERTSGDDYVKKPYDETEFLARVRHVLKRTNEKKDLYSKATRDTLTGLLNRDYFFENLDVKIKMSERTGHMFSIALIDLDHFKQVNDTYGHHAGDRVLANLARVLQSGLREYDIIARYGGEEFILYLADTSKKDALSIIDRIRSWEITTELSPEHRIINTFSGGISGVDDVRPGTVTGEKLVAIAGKRLYRAKEMGRNRVVMDD
ncbi:MAG: diguanylate cyclase [bacterium]|nr:diguanylate cyclase [bacterium]